MKAAFFFLLIILFRPGSDIANQSLAAGEAPIFSDAAVHDTADECVHHKDEILAIARFHGDIVVMAECHPVQYGTAL